VVEAGDIATCLADGTASGNQATVGSSWSVAQTNIDGAVIGPTSATDSGLVVFDGTTGKIVKAGSISLTGDATATLSGSGSAAVTFGTVNGDVGSFGDATHVPAVTVNAKGLVTAASSVAIAIPESAVTDLVSDLAAKALSGFEGKWPSGSYLQIDNTGIGTDVLLSAARAYYTPIWIPENGTLAEIAFHLTVNGGTGSVIRHAVYLPDSDGRPGPILADLGTVATNTGAGAIISHSGLSQAVTRGLLWVQTTPQGAPSPEPTLRVAQTNSRFVTLTTLNTGLQRAGYIETGVTSTPPSTATPLLTNNTAVPVVWLKRS
jgi:hypothetical protein